MLGMTKLFVGIGNELWFGLASLDDIVTRLVDAMTEVLQLTAMAIIDVLVDQVSRGYFVDDGVEIGGRVLENAKPEIFV